MVQLPSPGRLYRGLRRRLQPQFTRFEGQVLPAPHMRYCGPDFHDDAVFLGSAREEARRLVRDFQVGDQTRLLEIGCGPGRLPIGLIAEAVPVARYDGVDVDAAAIRWCQRHLAPDRPGLHFHHITARNERYNPDGQAMDDSFALPLEAGSYDLVYLHSIFTNMLESDVAVYCREFHRLLRPGGVVFLTAFVEEGVPPVTVNPEDYHIRPTGPFNVIRYEKEHFLNLLCKPGFEVAHFSYGTELGRQSAVHLRRG